MVLSMINECLCFFVGSPSYKERKFSPLCKLFSSAAIVRVSLLNKGADAWRHDDYGDYITIERRIDRHSASAQYRLLSGDPKYPDNLEMVSNLKSELDTILDRFNIQVSAIGIVDLEGRLGMVQITIVSCVCFLYKPSTCAFNIEILAFHMYLSFFFALSNFPPDQQPYCAFGSGECQEIHYG